MRTEQQESHNKPKEEFKLFKEFHDVVFRILLIDDKVGGTNDECKGIKQTAESPRIEYIDITQQCELSVSQCDDKKDCHNKGCKLCTIKRLLDNGKNGDHDNEDGKESVFEGIGKTLDYFYWEEKNIECFYCPTITKDFIDNEAALKDSRGNYYNRIQVLSQEEKHNIQKKTQDGNPLLIESDFKPIKTNDIGNKIQIVGVRDVRTALLLMSKYKFDMIFCDYLLYQKDRDSYEREYTNQLFYFLSHNYKDDIKNETDEGKRYRLSLLDGLRHDVLDNRGPLGKIWIMPVTGFNQTFIKDLYRNHINLIDYRWNISNGADPITTPWQFLYHLNKFIELQLRSCVYQREQLLQFLLYTCEDLKELERQKDDEKIIDFEMFKSFMGSEYATFMQLYGNKLPIQRDALVGSDNSDNKSIFATYIWNSFYRKPKYYDVIELNRLIHKFYHQASSMYNDGVGRQRLNEAFADLDFFVQTNSKIKKIIDSDNELSDLLVNDDNKGLAFLRKVIAKCTKEKTTDN